MNLRVVLRVCFAVTPSSSFQLVILKKFNYVAFRASWSYVKIFRTHGVERRNVMFQFETFRMVLRRQGSSW